MKHVVNCYENYREEDRLTTNNARKVEFLTTIRVLDEHFANADKVKILDCAAGTGIYAFYFADKGYNVTATDITPRHIQLINEKLNSKPYTMKTAVIDATDLNCFENESFDIVLNMGPLYHLTSEDMRKKCVHECFRVLKKGGLLVTSYISKYFIFPYLATNNSEFLKADFANILIDVGSISHDDENCFWTDTHYASANEMEELYTNFNLVTIDHFAQDGMAPMLRSIIDEYNDEQFKVWCDYHYKTCREKSILGASNHAIIIGKK